MNRKQLTIKQLLLIAFVLAGLLPATLVSFLSFYQAREALKKEILRDMQTLSVAVASDVERVLFERIQNVNSWSQLAIMQDIQIEDIDKRLSIFLAETQHSYSHEYRALHVINLQQHVIASSQPEYLGQSLTVQPVWFSLGKDTSPMQFGMIDQDVVQVSKAIKDANTGLQTGYLVAEFNWRVISDLLTQSVGSTASAALLDDQGHAIATSKKWGEQGHVLHVEVPLASQLSLPQLTLRVEKSHSVAVAPVHRLGYVFLVLLLMTIVFSLLLVRPIGRAIIKPLESLTLFVRNFHLGKESLPPKDGPPELQELSLAFATMIQELEASQAQLTRAAKLAIVGEMAAAMSHEVRTPLGIMRSSADVLLREPQLSEEGREVLGFVISEIERLNKLVSSLIDAARPRQPNLIPLELRQHIQHVIELLHLKAKERQIQIKLIADQMVTVLADQDQMTQVLMNLLINAIQILPVGGLVQVRLYAKEGNAMLIVEDNGPGIPLENQKHIFEPFFTQRSGGVGLGLAVVRQIIQAHHGDISYQTSQWQGAQFTIRLPLEHISS